MNDLEHACGRSVPRETEQKLRDYMNLLVEENDRQNLISRTTIAGAWERHILDSAQLLRFLGPEGERRLDIGSGAGLPGIVLAILTKASICLVEPRRLRAEFLKHCASDLGLSNVTVVQSKVERLDGSYDLITARAVADVSALLGGAYHLAHPGTRWVLPKGRSAAKELADAQASWQGRFRLETSITASDAAIVVAEGIAPKSGRRGRG